MPAALQNHFGMPIDRFTVFVTGLHVLVTDLASQQLVEFRTTRCFLFAIGATNEHVHVSTVSTVTTTVLHVGHFNQV